MGAGNYRPGEGSIEFFVFANQFSCEIQDFVEIRRGFVIFSAHASHAVGGSPFLSWLTQHLACCRSVFFFLRFCVAVLQTMYRVWRTCPSKSWRRSGNQDITATSITPATPREGGGPLAVLWLPRRLLFQYCINSTIPRYLVKEGVYCIPVNKLWQPLA